MKENNRQINVAEQELFKNLNIYVREYVSIGRMKGWLRQQDREELRIRQSEILTDILMPNPELMHQLAEWGQFQASQIKKPSISPMEKALSRISEMHEGQVIQLNARKANKQKLNW